MDLYRSGDEEAKEIMSVYFERTARAFSSFVNILDPDVIVCGGGMSDVDELYNEIPKNIIPYLASDIFLTPIVKLNMAHQVELEAQRILW